jgi:type IV secretion system protein VirB10
MMGPLSTPDSSPRPLGGNQHPPVRRLNRLPIIAAIALLVLFVAVIIYGLASRGIYSGDGGGIGAASDAPPAADFAERLKRGIPNGIIGEPARATVLEAAGTTKPEPARNPFKPSPANRKLAEPSEAEPEPDQAWRERLQREQEEQYLRERHRQRMARLQANDAAHDSPIAVDIGAPVTHHRKQNPSATEPRGVGAADLYMAAARAGLGSRTADPDGQDAKTTFLNHTGGDPGYLSQRLVPQRSRYELKRGSVIPATLVTGINSDLPGRITAQVSQNVYDSATGHHLLVPQGSKLLGRYDSKVSFGQRRVLVAWTDIVFPDGSTLHIAGMAGADIQGYGGFEDKVNNHYLRIFGSAVLVAAIGAGIDMALPGEGTRSNSNGDAVDPARRSFAETFGRIADRTISKNLDVQPTLEIRPGYRFNVLVDQDLVFPGAYLTK